MGPLVDGAEVNAILVEEVEELAQHHAISQEHAEVGEPPGTVAGQQVVRGDEAHLLQPGAAVAPLFGPGHRGVVPGWLSRASLHRPHHSTRCFLPLAPWQPAAALQCLATPPSPSPLLLLLLLPSQTNIMTYIFIIYTTSHNTTTVPQY